MSSSAKRKAKPKEAKAKGRPKAPERKKASKKVAAEKAKPKSKRVAAEKKETSVRPTPRPGPMVLGTTPVAVVSSRHLDSMHSREARGFSFGELSSAGVTQQVAKRQDLSIDVRRRSVVEKNVDALKGWLGSAREAPTSKVAVAAAAKKK